MLPLCVIKVLLKDLKLERVRESSILIAERMWYLAGRALSSTCVM